MERRGACGKGGVSTRPTHGRRETGGQPPPPCRCEMHHTRASSPRSGSPACAASATPGRQSTATASPGTAPAPSWDCHVAQAGRVLCCMPRRRSAAPAAEAPPAVGQLGQTGVTRCGPRGGVPKHASHLCGAHTCGKMAHAPGGGTRRRRRWRSLGEATRLRSAPPTARPQQRQRQRRLCATPRGALRAAPSFPRKGHPRDDVGSSRRHVVPPRESTG